VKLQRLFPPPFHAWIALSMGGVCLVACGDGEATQAATQSQAIASPSEAGSSGASPRSVPAPSPAPSSRPESVERIVQSVADRLDRSGARVTVTRRPDGTVTADLGGGYQHVIVARRRPEGGISQTCVTSVEAARQALAAPVGGQVR
jgi:hypothetical protein